MNKYIIIAIVIFVIGFLVGWIFTTATIARTAHEILSQYGYTPDVLIKECLQRHGL